MNVAMLLLAAIVGSLITIHVDTAPQHKLNTIRPLHAIGVGIDSDPAGKVPLLYSPAHTRQMLSAGLGVVSYRLYTELSIQDWHWNPAGRFSDAARAQGYWTSAAVPTRAQIVDSFGYGLPHRGSTRDQGDDDDYSRIDDGDATTYWKSDPYLTHAYTGDPDSAHPQWAVIDLNFPQGIDAVRVHWVDPYATRYQVQYWTGGDAILEQGSGAWHTYPGGTVTAGRGGNTLLRLTPRPQKARFLRILMTASSGTCDTHGAADPRNCAGFAIQDIELGTLDAHGLLRDIIRHNTCGGNPLRLSGCKHHQTIIFVSSIDPWHRARDRITNGQDQPGLDFVSRNAITRGLPMMYAVPLYYSTPANALAEIRYLKARGYPMADVEMGEEVDGQYALPEDYGALYIQFARAIHKEFPSLRLGGPIFQGVNADIQVWRDQSGDVSWFRRFLKYLRAHHAMNELNFMSFEHYPFKGCDQGAVLRMDLLREPSLVSGIVNAWRADGLPSSVPMYITESNFANDGGPVPKQMEGALWMADWIGTALSSGVAGINYYQYEAEPLGRKRECGKYGNYGMFIADDNYRILARAGQYYGAQMLTQYWLIPGDRPHELYAVTTDQPSAHPGLSAYAAKLPDGEWSIMIVNKDSETHQVELDLGQRNGLTLALSGPDITTFGSAQFAWHGDSATELPNPNHPPVTRRLPGYSRGPFDIPPLSITVIRGTAAGVDVGD